MQPNTVYTNGRVSLAMCMMFGLVVLTEDGWYPVEDLKPDELDMVRRLVDHDPVFPWKEQLYY